MHFEDNQRTVTHLNIFWYLFIYMCCMINCCCYKIYSIYITKTLNYKNITQQIKLNPQHKTPFIRKKKYNIFKASFDPWISILFLEYFFFYIYLLFMYWLVPKIYILISIHPCIEQDDIFSIYLLFVWCCLG